MKILITGGTGFIGSHLVRKLKQNHDLLILTVNQEDLNKESDNLKYIYQDLTKPWEVKDEPIDTVIHLAHIGAFSGSEVSNEVEANQKVAQSLLEYAKNNGAKSFIYASSGAVYGFGPNAFTEDSPLNPANEYGKAKVMVENLVKNSGLEYKILRFFFPYGPGTPKHQLFGKLIENIKTGGEITIKNDGEPKTNPTYIDDLVQGIADCLKLEESAILNLCGNEVVSIKDIVDLMAERIGKKASFKFIDEDPKGQNLMASNNLAREKINFNPKIKLEEGIDKLIKN